MCFTPHAGIGDGAEYVNQRAPKPAPPRTHQETNMSLRGLITTAAISLGVVLAYDKYGKKAR